MKRLYVLDAVRGLAALVVASHHFSIIAGGKGIDPFPQYAVDLFFALSGFVMARTYEARMLMGLSTTAFLKIRFQRLWLPLAIGTTLGLAWWLTGPTPFNLELVVSYALALAFLPTLWAVNAFAFNVPAWSLFLELTANALHSLFLVRLTSLGLCLLALSCAFWAWAILPSLGSGHWDHHLGLIVSLLPREMTFYLGGILIWRQFGDRLFDAELSTPLRAAAHWMGAVSYPLYATHVPTLWLGGAMGLPPLACFLAALMLAVGLAVFIDYRNSAPIHVRTLSLSVVPPVSGKT